MGIKYDKNDQPLSKQKYRLFEVKEDAMSLFNKMHNNRGSMKNIISNIN